MGVIAQAQDQIRLIVQATVAVTMQWTAIARKLSDASLFFLPLTQVVHSGNGARASSTTTIPFDCEILNGSVDCGTVALPQQSGIAWVQVDLKKQGSYAYAQLLADYWEEGHIPTYPGTPRFKNDNKTMPGNLVTKAGANPAAGAEVADTVPVTSVWRLWGIEVVLVTDATVANRNVNFFVDDAASTVTRRLILKDTTNQTATQTRTHHWSPGTEANDAASVSYTDTVTVLAKFPMSLQEGILLYGGYNLRTVTTGIVAGDDYGAPRYLVEELLTA